MYMYVSMGHSNIELSVSLIHPHIYTCIALEDMFYFVEVYIQCTLLLQTHNMEGTCTVKDVLSTVHTYEAR